MTGKAIFEGIRRLLPRNERSMKEYQSGVELEMKIEDVRRRDLSRSGMVGEM